MYDNLEKDRNRMEHEIEQCKDKIKNIEINIQNNNEKIEEVQRSIFLKIRIRKFCRQNITSY